MGTIIGEGITFDEAQVDAGREHLDFTEKRLRYLNPENQMVQKRRDNI